MRLYEVHINLNPRDFKQYRGSRLPVLHPGDVIELNERSQQVRGMVRGGRLTELVESEKRE